MAEQNVAQAVVCQLAAWGVKYIGTSLGGSNK
jgi:hypothetical protein